MRSAAFDAVLLALVALVVTAALSALGALLVAALVVVPAATVRLWTSRLPAWQAATVALVAVEGTAGLWLSVKLNAPSRRHDRDARRRGVRSGSAAFSAATTATPNHRGSSAQGDGRAQDATMSATPVASHAMMRWDNRRRGRSGRQLVDLP